MDVLASTSVTLWADFEAPEGLEIPDAGSVTFTLYDGTGTPLSVTAGLMPDADASGVSVPLHATFQVIAPGRAFERRRLIVNWMANGRSRSTEQTYRVVPPPPYSVSAHDVRSYLGVSIGELPNRDIDLFSAYLTLRQVVGADLLDAALASGTVSELRAERAIVLTAATGLFPSMQYRVAQKRTDGNYEFERIKDPAALDRLIAATAEELLALSNGLAGVDVTVALAPALILLGTNTTDPITGAAPVAVGA